MDDLHLLIFSRFTFSFLLFPPAFLIMNNYVTRVALGKVADHVQSKPSIAETDPEIRAAMETAVSSTKKHWWKKRPQADIILSAHDRQILRTVKKRAWYLDRGCKCCCLQVGLDGVVGMLLMQQVDINDNDAHMEMKKRLDPSSRRSYRCVFSLTPCQGGVSSRSTQSHYCQDASQRVY